MFMLTLPTRIAACRVKRVPLGSAINEYTAEFEFFTLLSHAPVLIGSVAQLAGKNFGANTTGPPTAAIEDSALSSVTLQFSGSLGIATGCSC
jgi:hypothetical protein